MLQGAGRERNIVIHSISIAGLKAINALRKFNSVKSALTTITCAYQTFALMIQMYVEIVDRIRIVNIKTFSIAIFALIDA